MKISFLFYQIFRSVMCSFGLEQIKPFRPIAPYNYNYNVTKDRKQNK
jgi:hypothetical protein